MKRKLRISQIFLSFHSEFTHSDDYEYGPKHQRFLGNRKARMRESTDIKKSVNRCGVMSHDNSVLSSLSPIQLKSFVQKYVEITLLDGKKYVGTVYTIDPITKSVLLMSQEEGKVGMSFFPGSNLESLEVRHSSCVPDMEHLFRCSGGGPGAWDEEEAERRASRLMAWLSRNRVPIRRDGDVLRLEDVLEIHAPYGVNECYSTNETVLSRVQVLVSKMPDTSETDS